MRKITVLYDGTLYTYVWLKAILTLNHTSEKEDIS